VEDITVFMAAGNPDCSPEPSMEPIAIAGEWRCLKAAALGEGEFDESVQVVSFVKCICPGRSLVPNIGMAAKLSEIKPDEIYLSSCLVNEEMAKIIEKKTGVKVKLGTHEYHI
jgi:predicted metal-binding protein